MKNGEGRINGGSARIKNARIFPGFVTTKQIVRIRVMRRTAVSKIVRKTLLI